MCNMRQDVTKSTQSSIKKRFQISYRRWLTGKSGGGTVSVFMGENVTFVRDYISSLFLLGMNWNNYGDIWVVDHIVPLRLFDMTNNEECAIAFHYKNTVPLFKQDNLYKEGDLRFSILLLELVPACIITDKLNSMLKKEIQKSEKYLCR